MEEAIRFPENCVWIFFLFFFSSYCGMLVLVAICLVGLLGNGSVMAVFLRNRLLLLQPANLLLLNMCLADFVNLLFNPFFFLFRYGRQINSN